MTTTMTHPKYSKEPGFSIDLVRGYGGPWICLAWYPGEQSYRLQAFGPFPTKTEAIEWGKTNFPRRYRIGSIRTPDDHEFFLHHEALQINARYENGDD